MSIWDFFKRPTPPTVEAKPKLHRCMRCKLERPTSDFHRHKVRGVQPWCKECNGAYKGAKRRKKGRHAVPVLQQRTLNRKTVSVCIKNVPIEARVELQKIAERRKVPMERLGLDMIKDFITLHSKN